MIRSLIASHSVTAKSINRDAHSSFKNEYLHLTGVAIADGIGSTENVEALSQFVVQNIKVQIEGMKMYTELNMNSIVNNCKEGLFEKFGLEFQELHLGTTLIVAVEYVCEEKTIIKVGYLGNGAILHIKGNFNQFNETQLYKWNCVNYLNPHSILQNGKEVLINFISTTQSQNNAIPTTLEFSSDEKFGDIVMICTDGIYSFDQVVCSEDSFGDIWIKQGFRMNHFLNNLNDYFRKGNYTEKSLNEMLVKYLIELKITDSLEDDATVGLIVLPKAFKYQLLMHNESQD